MFNKSSRFNAGVGSRKIEDVTVLLTVFKRDTLDLQLEALKKQSVQPKEIVVYHDCDFQKIPKRRLVREGYQVVENSFNTRYIGRFAYLINAPTTWLAVLDDDLIPGPKWLENYLGQAQKLDGIVGGMGRIGRTNPLRSELFQPEDAGLRPSPVITDYAGQCWVFSKHLLFEMFSIPPVTYMTGEDMHLCFSAKIRSGTKTYVAAQRTEDEMCDVTFGRFTSDQHASYKVTPANDRKEVERYFTGMGMSLIDHKIQEESRISLERLGY